MRSHLIAPVLLVCVVSLAAAPSWADAWTDPGAVTEAICAVSHAGENHAGESANGFIFDGVPFTASTLSNVDFKNASLQCIDDVTLTCDTDCVDFTAAILDDAQFQNANATGAGFVGASAARASFSRATLDGAVMLGADLTSTVWDGASAVGADLGQSDLSDARGRSDETPTSFNGASLRGATLLRVDFGASETSSRTDFGGADLRQSWADCRYEQVEVVGEDGEETTETIVSDCPDFTWANFAGADLRGLRWRGVDLGGASFASAATRFSGATFDDVDLTAGGTAGADLSDTVLEGVALREAIFIAETPDTMGHVAAAFDRASLARADFSRSVLCHPFEFVEEEPDPGEEEEGTEAVVTTVADLCTELETTPTTCVDWVGATSVPVQDRSLVRASLLGAHAPGIPLPGFDLQSADLRLADFRCATLDGADLRDAILDGADLGGASLLELAPGAPADLSGVVGKCMYPPVVDGVLPDPQCPSFESASLEGASFYSAILDGATFERAQAQGTDFTFLQSACEALPVDPDSNGGLSTRRFCIDFTGASLGPDGGGASADFTGSLLTGPIFDSIDADGVVMSGVGTFCVDGRLPADDPDGNPVDHRFCPSFAGATITRADFTEALMSEAVFGCLDDDGIDAPEWVCTDLRGARFADARLLASTWVGPIDLRDFDPSTSTDLSNADLAGATIRCQGLTYTLAGSEEILAEQRCPDFTGTNLTPGLDLTGAGIYGVDWTSQDLRGVDLTGATLGCFEFKYDDEDGAEQSLPQICTQLSGAVLTDAVLTELETAGMSLVGVVLTRADLGGADLSGADLTGATFDEAQVDENTRFYADYEPDPADTNDQKKDDCRLEEGATATNVRGASLAGVDFTEVVDFGGDCIEYDIYTTYDEDTIGLTETLKRTMTFVPEPGTAVVHAAALATLGLLARRRRAR